MRGMVSSGRDIVVISDLELITIGAADHRRGFDDTGNGKPVPGLDRSIPLASDEEEKHHAEREKDRKNERGGDARADWQLGGLCR